MSIGVLPPPTGPAEAAHRPPDSASHPALRHRRLERVVAALADEDLDAVVVRGVDGAHAVLGLVPATPSIWAVIHRDGTIQHWSEADHAAVDIVGYVVESLLSRHGTAAPVAVGRLGLAAERCLSIAPLHVVDAEPLLAELRHAPLPEELTVIREGIRRAEHLLHRALHRTLQRLDLPEFDDDAGCVPRSVRVTRDAHGAVQSIGTDGLGFGGYATRIEQLVDGSRPTASTIDRLARSHLHSRYDAIARSLRADLSVDEFAAATPSERAIEQTPGGTHLALVHLGGTTALATETAGTMRVLRSCRLQQGDVLALTLRDPERNLRVAGELLLTADGVEFLTSRSARLRTD